MEMEEAIKTLKSAKLAGDSGYYRDLGDAIELGIEALKRVDFSRRDPNRPSEPLLPGETED